MSYGEGQVNDSILGVIGHPFEQFKVKVVVRIIEDEFLMQSDGGTQFVF